MRSMSVDELRAQADKVRPLRKEDPPSASGVRLIEATSVAIEPVRWLWGGWLARGKLHVLAGPPGVGKSTIALALAATVTRGTKWPDGTRAEPGTVLIWSGEDDAGDTLLPRLLAAGGDPKRVRFLASNDGPFDPAVDMQALQEAVAGIDDLALLLLDPIVGAVGAADDHKNGAVRRSLQPVVDFAHATGSAVLGVSHFSKGTAGRAPTERVTGSLAFAALARVVLVATREQGEDGRRILARAKSNLGPDQGGFAYALEQTDVPDVPGIRASAVRWREPINGTAAEILAACEANPDEVDAMTEAAEFLLEMLKAGTVQSKTVEAAAKQRGISTGSLARAKKRLGVVSRKEGLYGGWTWRLPEDSKGAEDAEH